MTRTVFKVDMSLQSQLNDTQMSKFVANNRKHKSIDSIKSEKRKAWEKAVRSIVSSSSLIRSANKRIEAGLVVVKIGLVTSLRSLILLLRYISLSSLLRYLELCNS